MTIFSVLFIIATYCIVRLRLHPITTEPPLRSHWFKNSVNQFHWNKEAETLVVGSENNRTLFDKHFEVIKVKETVRCSKQFWNKCKHDHKYAEQVLAICLGEEKVCIPCEPENKDFCIMHILEASAITKNPVEPTAGHKNSDKIEWRSGESRPNNKTFYIESERKNTKVILGFLRRDGKFIISTHSSEGQQLETTLTRFSAKEEGRYSSSELIISCGDEKQSVWHVPTSAYFSNKIFSLGTFQKYIKNGEVLFINLKRIGLNGRHHESALCMFPLAQFDDHMKEADTEQGFGRKRHLHGMPLLLYEEEGTSLAVKTENNHVLAFIGTSQGNLLKFELFRHLFPSPLFNMSLLPYRGTNQPSTSGIRASSTFDNTEENLFLLLDNTVIRFPVSSCFPYQTSNTCIEGPLACGWCETECTVREHCSGKFAKDWTVYYQAASVELNFPTSGPLEGGTILKLRTSFSGLDMIPQEEQVQFTVGDIPCKNIIWKRLNEDLNQEWSVECKTGMNNKECIVPVVMHISEPFSYKEIAKIESSSSFSYLKPQLFRIHPYFGPKAGGTNLTLYGKLLSIGSTRKVLLDEVTCDILELTDERILCKTGPLKTFSTGVHQSRVRLWIDGNLFELTGPSTMNIKREFEYRMDPVIIQVSPNVTIVSGGTPIIANGRHLNSAQTVELLVTVKGFEKAEICTATNNMGTEISCATPPLGQSIARPVGHGSVQATMSFRFDVVLEKELMENSRAFPQRVLAYYPDPVLQARTAILTENDIGTKILVFEGINLNTTFKMSDVQITLNDTGFCTVTALTFSALNCEIWPTAWERLRNETGIHDVKVRFGKWSYKGLISLKPISSQNQAPYKDTMSLSKFLLILLLIIVIIGIAKFCIFVRFPQS